MKDNVLYEIDFMLNNKVMVCNLNICTVTQLAEQIF